MNKAMFKFSIGLVIGSLNLACDHLERIANESPDDRAKVLNVKKLLRIAIGALVDLED